MPANYSHQWNLTPGVDEYDNEVDVTVSLTYDGTVIVSTLDEGGDEQEVVLTVQDLINLVNYGKVY